MEFSEVLGGLKGKSHWTTWLSTDTSKAAVETKAFLSTCYQNIPQSKMVKLEERLQKAKSEEVESIFRELITHELLKRLDLQPTWSPVINGKNPDLDFCVNGVKYIADVFITHSPQKTIKRVSENLIESWDNPDSPSESRTKKIKDRISEKCKTYSELELPLVLFIFLEDNLSLEFEMVEMALFEGTIKDISNEQNYPSDNAYYPSYANLVAVITCKWFDTINLLDEGRRLRCVVLHNWATTGIPLPTEAFASFGQVTWNTDGKLKRPQYIGDHNMVAKFEDNGVLKMHPYSTSMPW